MFPIEAIGLGVLLVGLAWVKQLRLTPVRVR
jgi:hypothetical protein